MGHYLCPRCGSSDSYLGNTLVSRRGGTVTTELGDSGIYVTSSTGGVESAQIVKCRNCSEILSSSNYVKSESEVRREAEDKAETRAAWRKLSPDVLVVLIVALLAVLLTLLI